MKIIDMQIKTEYSKYYSNSNHDPWNQMYDYVYMKLSILNVSTHTYQNILKYVHLAIYLGIWYDMLFVIK